MNGPNLDAAMRQWFDDLVGQGVLVTGDDLVIVAWNHWLEAHSGRQASELIGRPLFEVFPSLVSRGLDTHYRQALAGHAAVLAQGLHRYLLPMPAMTRDSAYDHMQQSARIAPLVEHGRVVGTVTVLEDVTDRVAREDELRRQVYALQTAQRDMQFLSEAGAALASSLDYETTLSTVTNLAVPYIAQSCMVALVDPQREAAGLDLIALADVDEQRAARLREHWEQHASRVAEVSGLLLAVREGRPQLTTHASGPVDAPVPGNGTTDVNVMQAEGLESAIAVPLIMRGEVIGVIGFARAADVTRPYAPDDLDMAVRLAHHVAMALDNARLYGEAREAVRAREQFLSIASHELRTPVTVIQGYVQSMMRHINRQVTAASAQSGAEPPTLVVDRERLVSNLRRMNQATHRLTALVRELLDVSRLLQKRLDVALQRTDLSAVVNEALDSVWVQLQQQGLEYGGDHELLVHLPEDGLWGMWDPRQLEQVIINLLDNAVKYSPEGGRIEVSLVQEDSTPARAHLTVADEGIGISAEQQGHLFELFARGTDATASRLPGLGLGLAISKDIVERHSGRIWAESAGPGRGSKFHVVLPCEPSRADAAR